MYYVGANDQLFNWYYNGHWSNGQLGHGEAAIAHSGLSALLQPDGYSSVFYTGSNGQIYAWVFSTTTSWGNKVLGVPAGVPGGTTYGHGEAAAASSAISAQVFSDGQQNLYYIGADRGVYTWRGNTGTWYNYELP